MDSTFDNTEENNTNTTSGLNLTQITPMSQRLRTSKAWAWLPRQPSACGHLRHLRYLRENQKNICERIKNYLRENQKPSASE